MLADLRTWLIANVAEVAALSGQKVHVQTAPQGTLTPHLLLMRLAEDPLNHLGGRGGLNSADVDIDCKAPTPDAASALADAVIAVLEPYSGAMGETSCEAVILNDTRDWNETEKPGRGIDQYVTTLDLTIQYR